jgi:Protein of unknown function (DUF1566)
MYKQILFTTSLLIMLSLSCQKDPNPTLQSRLDKGESPTTLLDSYPVDSFYAKIFDGGYIFTLKSNGSGMLVDLSDLSSTASWGCAGNNITGAEGKIVGTGQANTTEIVSGCGDFSAAAGLCDNSTTAGYTDWYLPSEDELFLVYQNVHTKGVGGFANDFYWTSTEVPSLNAAQHILFNNGSINFSTKTNTHYVRAIRNF